MSSSIANKVKINIYLVWIKIFVALTVSWATVSNLSNNNYFVIFLYSSVLLSTNNRSVDLYNGILQTTTVLFTRNFTQDGLNSYWLPAFFCDTNSLTNGLKFSRTISRHILLLGNSVYFVDCLYIFLSYLFLLVYLEHVRCIC